MRTGKIKTIHLKGESLSPRDMGSAHHETIIARNWIASGKYRTYVNLIVYSLSCLYLA